MGTNLLRYALWREHGELPIAALDHRCCTTRRRARSRCASTSTPSTTARATRRLRSRRCAARTASRRSSSSASSTTSTTSAWRSRCGIRVLVQRSASPLLREYVVRQGLCDYITAHPPERHAVREVCELLLGLLGSFEAVVASRVAWDRRLRRLFRRAPGDGDRVHRSARERLTWASGASPSICCCRTRSAT